MAEGAEVQVAAGVDPAALAQITTQLTNAISSGFEKGFAQLRSALTQLAAGPVAEFGKQMDKAINGGKAQEGFEKTESAARNLGGALSQSAKDSLTFAAAYREISTSLTGLTASIQRETAVLKTGISEQNTSLIAGSNERTALLRNEGKLAAIETQTAGQLAVRAARTSGQERVAIVRGVVDTIGRLEKGLGATLSGIARTSVGAVSKVFDGLKSVFSRADRETFTNSTFERSLKERESELRTSFERQTNIVREQVTRQETAIAGLREQANAGVLGAANRSGLFGGLALGFAGLAAIKSTFTVGADFARGLSVLQASLDLTDVQMKKVRQTSIDLGNDITLPGVSALDAAQAIQTLTKQFGSLGPAAVDAAQAAAKGTLQLARASGASADDAAALIGSAVNVFGVSANDAVGAADKIAGALTRAAGVGFADFKDSFVQGATVFNDFVGKTEDANSTLLDFNTTLAILAKNGITGSNAGAGLKQFFIQATANTKSASEASKELAKRAGLSGSVFFDASGKARAFSDSIDILRRGVKGLSDQAETNVLGDLFGSRSITVARALINSTGESFAALREQIAKQGIAAKIAAAQNTGLKGALDAFQSVAETLQIIVFEKINKPLGDAVLAITNFANTVLFSASPAMHTLRVALLGVVTGLGALLALKTAVEVITLLGRAAALALTPMGALALIFAGVGVAIALLTDSNKGFVDQLKAVGLSVVGFGQDLAQKAKPVIQDISNFIQQTAIPTVIRWAGVVKRDLIGAFDATVRFFKETVIPGFQAVLGFITGEIFPRVTAVAQTVVTAVLRAKDAVIGFAQDVAGVVGPLIGPAITGFKNLGIAVGDFVTGGGIGRLGSGLASAGAGIGESFANIGVAIFNALKPLGLRIFNFFKDVFSVHNLIGALGEVGNFLNFIGEQLALIVTNPKVLAAVGIIAGVAAKLAFDLASGIVEGIAENLPRLLADVWQLAVKFAFKPEIITAAVLGSVAAIGIAGIVRSFQTLGQGGASGFVAGFKSKLSGATDFFSGVLGGPDAAQFGAQKSFFRQFEIDIQSAQNKLRALGSETIIDPSKSGLKDAQEEIKNLTTGLSDATIKGLEFRDKVSVAFRGIGDALSGAGGIVSGLAQIPAAFGRAGIDAVKALGSAVKSGAEKLVTLAFGDPSTISNEAVSTGSSFGQKLRDGLRSAGGTIKDGFTQITDSLKQVAAETGLTSGAAMAKAVGIGLAKGAAAVGSGVFFGQQLGSNSGTSQLLGLSGLVGTAAALGPVFGTATVLVGGLTAAFTKNQEAARIAKQNVQDYVKVLESDFKAGLDGATTDQLNFSAALQKNDFVNAITDKLGPDTIAALDKIGVHQQDLVKIFEEGSPAVERLAARLGSSTGQGLIVFTQASKDVTDAFKQSGTAIDQYNRKLEFTTGQTADTASATKKLSGTFGEIFKLLTAGASSVKDSGDALDRAGIQADDFTTKVTGAAAAFNRTFTLTTGKSNAVTDVNRRLQETLTLKDQIDQAFAQGVLPPGITGFQDAINQGLIGVSGAASRITDIIKGAASSGTVDGISDAVKEAQVNNVLKGLGDEASRVIAAGVKGGQIFDATSARSALQPLLDEAVRGLGPDSPVKAQIEATFANIVATLTPTIDQDAAATQTATTLETVKSIIENAPPFVLPVSVGIPKGLSTADNTFATDVLNAAGIQAFTLPSVIEKPTLVDGWAAAALAEIDANKPTLVLDPVQLPINFASTAASAGSAAGEGVGSAIDAGVAAGINSGRSSVTTAARSVATSAVRAMNDTLGIHSPSTVFATIGRFMIAGLQKGIADGATDLSGLVTDVIAKAVDAATGAVNDATRTLRTGGSSLFAALFGSDSTVGRSSFGGIQAEITGAFQSLASTLDDSFSKAADVLNRSATEALSRADLNILGESPTSLNPNDVLGAANRGALAGAIDQIVSLGKSLIDQGVPAAQVTQTMSTYLDSLRALATQYGLSVDDVNNLINQMGLGSDALSGFVDATASLAASLGQTTTAASAFNDTVVALFKSTTAGSKFASILGVGGAEDARAAVVAGAGTLAAAIDAVDARAQAIIDKRNKGETLTAAEQLALNQGLNNRSINLTDQLGVANRQAFEAQIANIARMGQALLEGGSSADVVTGQINEQIQALENYGAFLGFNRDQIEALVNEAGLGAGSLADFIKAVTDAGVAAKQAADATAAGGTPTPPTPPDTPAAGNNPAPTPPTQPTVTIIQNLPYADPAAIALAASNGVAAAVRLPV